MGNCAKEPGTGPTMLSASPTEVVAATNDQAVLRAQQTHNSLSLRIPLLVP